ncbi:MAG: NFACT RNA binding domain-containing protein [Sulfurimonas sp.]|uniref:NFACT RNA binding domain-containing protein n=1 Tax=Sulfurimonas sp. TaxID=2022749 RepID=UPI0025D301DC|nr:NFACT RNA binding domain-containing protein [Sulfurimonas sp.]MCK9492210.1 NFACT RNA binding domain-containing protein [Sulfurimonas sp.]
MKYSHLKQIKDYFSNFQKISAIHRVSDTIVKVAFDRDDEVYFEMQRSNSKIFRCDSYTRSKVYNAPFDVVLSKRFNRANILEVDLVDDDKILRFKTSVASAYKEEITYLQFEFTGKYTNVIIFDEDEIVLEALRHVDIFSSFREVKVGQKLLSVPSAPYTPKEYPIDDVEKFLYDEYQRELDAKLKNLKKQKLLVLNKRLQKLQKLQSMLEDETGLAQEAQTAQLHGNLVLSNLHNIKAYQKKIELQDYDGKLVEIELAKEFSSPSSMAQALFKKSKKAKQKALHLHIERASILSKIEHAKLFIAIVEDAKDMAKLELLFPKQVQAKKLKVSDSIESFWIEGYKVQLGKNEKGNIELLKSAKAKDIWIHMKDRPSAHLIITTDKQNVAEHIIREAAKLCVEFSTAQKDKFLVDYTPRREVTIQSGANVLYNKYKTIEVDVR